MSETHRGGCASGGIGQEGGDAPALGAAGWLGLAAAPTFAIMALLTALLGSDAPDMLCSAMQHGSALGGDGADVRANERLPCCALAETDLRSAKRRSADFNALHARGMTAAREARPEN